MQTLRSLTIITNGVDNDFEMTGGGRDQKCFLELLQTFLAAKNSKTLNILSTTIDCTLFR